MYTLYNWRPQKLDQEPHLSFRDFLVILYYGRYLQYITPGTTKYYLRPQENTILAFREVKQFEL